MLLGYAGHRVFEAADGEAGLEMARQSCPDLVISDIVMPTMDGIESSRRLRAEPLDFETLQAYLADLTAA